MTNTNHANVHAMWAFLQGEGVKREGGSLSFFQLRERKEPGRKETGSEEEEEEEQEAWRKESKELFSYSTTTCESSFFTTPAVDTNVDLPWQPNYVKRNQSFLPTPSHFSLQNLLTLLGQKKKKKNIEEK